MLGKLVKLGGKSAVRGTVRFGFSLVTLVTSRDVHVWGGSSIGVLGGFW